MMTEVKEEAVAQRNHMADSASYRNIFKTTFLFGFVQVFNIIVKVGVNKVIALLLGSEGIGTAGLFNNTIQVFTNLAGLGVNQSAVRDIAEGHGCDNRRKCCETIIMVRRTIKFTALFGALLMIALAPFLSQYTFGNANYGIAYMFLSIAVGANIMAQGQHAILTGMRKLKQMAYANMLGSITGAVFALPFYYFLHEKGIVPSIIATSIGIFFITSCYSRQIPVKKIALSLKDSIRKSSSMVRMGISLMSQGLMLQVCNLAIASYISTHGGLSILGHYQAGVTIITGYFGMVLTAMSTEYYPRISSICHDNEKLKDAVNAQSEMGLMLAFPLVSIFVFFSPLFFKFLYNQDFIAGTQYVDYAVMGTVSIICSNCIGMVLLAKQKSKLFLSSSLAINIIVLSANIVLYNLWGLTGLGLGYFFSGLVQLIVNNFIMRRYFAISFSGNVIAKWLTIILTIVAINQIKRIPAEWLRYTLALTIILSIFVISLRYLSRKMNVNIVESIRKKFTGKVA